MRSKILGICIVCMLIAMLATPLVVAKPWDYPKNNDKFEEFGVTYGFIWDNCVAANYAATAGLEEANKVVVVFDEQPVSYQIRIGEDGPGQRVYNLGEDFTYSGVGTVVTWDPVLPYEFDITDILGTLFVPGSRQHFRVDYTYDFSSVSGGLEGSITLVALLEGNSIILGGDEPMHIFSTKCTGDFKNVQIQATAGPSQTHMGIVANWPE